MFGGPDESIIEAQTVKIVVVKKAHTCMCPANTKHGGKFHEIKPGEKAVCDRAIVDGTWGASYTCLPCLQSWENHITNYGKYCTVCEEPTKEKL